MVLDKICIHHFGGKGNNPFAKTSSQTETEINSAHQSRWSDFPSELNGSFIGYNCIIWPTGNITQYRFLGEETAAQKGNNFDTISICLAGNFTKGVELPTGSQVEKLKTVLNELITGKTSLVIKKGTTLQLSKERIYPHRVLQKNHTECYGSALSDSWATDLVSSSEEQTIELQRQVLTLLQRIRILLQQLIHQNRKFGGFSGCDCARG